MAGAGDACSCPCPASDASRRLLLWGPTGLLETGQQNAESKPRGSREAQRPERQKEQFPEQPSCPGSPLGLSPPARLGHS